MFWIAPKFENLPYIYIYVYIYSFYQLLFAVTPLTPFISPMILTALARHDSELYQNVGSVHVKILQIIILV